MNMVAEDHFVMIIVNPELCSNLHGAPFTNRVVESRYEPNPDSYVQEWKGANGVPKIATWPLSSNGRHGTETLYPFRNLIMVPFGFLGDSSLKNTF